MICHYQFKNAFSIYEVIKMVLAEFTANLHYRVYNVVNACINSCGDWGHTVSACVYCNTSLITLVCPKPQTNVKNARVNTCLKRMQQLGFIVQWKIGLTRFICWLDFEFQNFYLTVLKMLLSCHSFNPLVAQPDLM